MPKEYIERDELKQRLEKVKSSGIFGEDMKQACLNVVEDVPSVDVVEVVRCGQCKLWKINPNNLYGGQCRYSECASIDHFCSRGVRKDG